MMRNISGFVLLIFLVQCLSCTLTDNDQPIPSFLDLRDPQVLTSDLGGTDTHKITDVWVFADGQILGVFPLPARVPLINTDNDTEITILAGIRNNGMNDTPVFYPFYRSIVKVIKPIPNEAINIPLVFQYILDAKVPINESFETSNVFSLDFDNNPATNISVISGDASIGQKCGKVSFDTFSTLEVGSTIRIADNQNARGKSYIELDYKGDGEIAVGIAKTTNGIIKAEYVLFVPARAVWNKIYIDVTDKLSPRDYDEYRLIFGFRKTGASTQSSILIDNIKHLHF
ncbi:MAG: hypothetical protein WBO36_08745 [Saprospiraceae bacterium]